MNMTKPVSALLTLCLAFALMANVRAAEERPLVFGVLNQQSPLLTAERWNPLLTYLTEATGIPLQLKMGRTVQETDAMMGRGEFDLVYTNHNFQTEYDGVPTRSSPAGAADRYAASSSCRPTARCEP